MDIPTPNIDSIAREGVRCTNGYVSSPRCAPSRCGLLTGRYQQRFGCDTQAEQGLPEEETTLAERLKLAGHATGLVGKWHLGMEEGDDPNARGFDEFYGFLGGANAYLPRAPEGGIPNILRNREPVQEKEYLTDAIGREAVAFIDRHRSESFFLLVAFSAPHRPLEAPREYKERFPAIADPARRAYAAMVSAMDDATGRVLERLRQLGLEEKTLVVFLSDNGGPQGEYTRNGSSNGILRGQKGSTWEGGLRVPFLLRLRGTLPAGETYDHPVTSLDITPTALALAGVHPDPGWRLDGVDLTPYLTGKSEGSPHEALYWRFLFRAGDQNGVKWAIRQGDLKLVYSPDRESFDEGNAGGMTGGLFDVLGDPGERNDLTALCREEARALEERWREWNSGLPPPFLAGKGAGDVGESEDD